MFKEVIFVKCELFKKVKVYGFKVIGEVKVENIIGGMCGFKVMVWEGFVFDVNEGICFYGCIIKDC